MRYKKIDSRIWGDKKFNNLTPPPPCGQALWWRLIVPREGSNIPGLFVAGERALAEHLRWTLKGFRKAFNEIESQGMIIADWKTGLLFLPNAIKYHSPESPNVITSWRNPWDELPECQVKVQAYQALRRFIQEKPEEKWLEAFDKAIPEPIQKGFQKDFTKDLPKARGKPLANQEQEQYGKGEVGELPYFENFLSLETTSSSSKAPELTEKTGTDDVEGFEKAVRELLKILPGVEIRVLKSREIQELRERGIDFHTVNAACWLAVARRACAQSVLSPVVSFRYFKGAIQDVIKEPTCRNPRYVAYLREKVEGRVNELASVVQ